MNKKYEKYLSRQLYSETSVFGFLLQYGIQIISLMIAWKDNFFPMRLVFCRGCSNQRFAERESYIKRFQTLKIPIKGTVKIKKVLEKIIIKQYSIYINVIYRSIEIIN
jgi:hypothetical protein